MEHAMRGLAEGFKHLFYASIIGLLGGLLVFLLALFMGFSLAGLSLLLGLGNPILAGFSALALILLGLSLVALAALYYLTRSARSFRESMRELSETHREASLGVTGATIYYYGSLLAIAGALISLTLIGVIIGLPVILAGLILAAAGLLILLVNLYTLMERLGIDVKAPLILVGIGIILYVIFPVLGGIILAVGSHHAYSRLELELAIRGPQGSSMPIEAA